jgi:hypothetical protein
MMTGAEAQAQVDALMLKEGRTPGIEDYHLLDPNTYDGEFFQEDGLEGSFEIDLTQPIEMEVDNEMGVDDDDAEEVQNDDDLRLLE